MSNRLWSTAGRFVAGTVKLVALLFVLNALWGPPWTLTTHYGSVRSEKPWGRASLWSPPEPPRDSSIYGVRVDYGLLMLELLFYATIFGAAHYYGPKRGADAS